LPDDLVFDDNEAHSTRPKMAQVFQLKITLGEIEPEIWRRVVVPSSLTLAELHAVIQGAIGWQDSHLHMYEIGGRRYEIPGPDGSSTVDECRDERAYRLEDLLTKGMEFVYVYDFGDDWGHWIDVEELREADHRETRPKCTAGNRACPPEDCGGPYGYPEFLDALADPSHPEHTDIKEWAGEFEPEAFSTAQSNSLIAAILALYRERSRETTKR
jgi:hypothetical protein